MATKLDFKRELRELYNASRDPELVDVPELNYLMVDGHGDPNTAVEYREAVEALYAISYAAKFIVKGTPGGVDYGVLPLEGLWWATDMSAFTAYDKSAWDWTMMIMQPDVVTAEILEQALAKTAKKGLAAQGLVRLERFAEGRCAQVMHLGPYAAEAPTIQRLHAFIADQGLQLRGKHHEIYLSDPRRTTPEKMKTISRQPVSTESTA
ncbi:MAG TPA: GyrI-like domain-containing protein [Jiangellaceae bacterium]